MRKVVCFIILLIVSSTHIIFAQEIQREVPKNIRDFVKVHFTKYNISKFKIDNDDKEYEVDLDSGHEITFDFNGNWLEIEGEYTPLPKSIIDLLPANIPQYIAKNYPKKVIVKIEQKKYGYKIELANSLELKFNSTGNFIGKD